MKKQIVDVCCGGRMFYYNKNNPSVLYLDNRECEKGHNKYRMNHCVKPDKVMDFRNLDLPSNSFRMVIFDPPHLVLKSDNSNLARIYGKLNPDTWKEDLKKGFDECWRVCEVNGFVVFKWNETNVSIKDMLELFGRVPLFGNQQGTKLKTHWVVYFKELE